MRFGMIDLLFAVGCMTVGMLIGSNFAPYVAKGARPVVVFGSGFGIYFALVYPFYRMLRLFPMILPRCPCCDTFQPGYHILGGVYPRIRFKCPGCNGEFIIWHNGHPGNDETWETPVLALKWPYALGRYRRMEKASPVHPVNPTAATEPDDRPPSSAR